jgi:hypothetical protein
MQTSKRSIGSKEYKAPKVIKSSSSSEKSKLASLRTPKEGSYKNNDESVDNKSNASSKMSFWGSPDVSKGTKKLFELIKINEESKLLLTSMDLGNVRNMIQLSDQDLHDIISLFSRQDLSDPYFQDSTIKIFFLGKCFKLVLKEMHDLGERDNIPVKLIPSSFSEEDTFLDADNMFILKRHYMKCYVPLRNELLDHLEDLMTQDSLVGSTVNTRSKKCGSFVSRMSSPSVKSVITEASKVSEVRKPKETARMTEYYSPLDFYPKNLNHAFMPKPDFEGYRQEAKKQYEGNGRSPSLLDEDLHQMPDIASTFMTRIR